MNFLFLFTYFFFFFKSAQIISEIKIIKYNVIIYFQNSFSHRIFHKILIHFISYPSSHDFRLQINYFLAKYNPFIKKENIKNLECFQFFPPSKARILRRMTMHWRRLVSRILRIWGKRKRINKRESIINNYTVYQLLNVT